MADKRRRRCPVCGTEGELAHCTQDGSPTIAIFACSAGDIGAGAVIGDAYVVGPMIGEGVASRVFAGTVAAGSGGPNGASCVIKVLKFGDGDRREAFIRFVREAETTGRLNSPYTVEMLDYGRTVGHELFVVLERLSGERLDERLKRLQEADEQLDEGDIVKIAHCLLGSLGEAHQVGLVHRDVQPSNVIFHEVVDEETGEEREIVKLIDFGTVRLRGSKLTARGQRLGPPAYMSPEQARGKKVDGRSDLYSLGCVLYECVAGRPPFDPTRGRIDVMLAHLKEKPPALYELRPDVDTELTSTIARALGKEPTDRFQSALAMANALPSIPGVAVPAATSVSRGGNMHLPLIRLEKMGPIRGRKPQPSGEDEVPTSEVDVKQLRATANKFNNLRYRGDRDEK